MATTDNPASTASAALAAVWNDCGLPAAALANAELPEQAPSLPSSFNVGAAAQASIGAAALAAEQLYHQRSGRHQQVRVQRRAAELECTGYFHLNGRAPSAWEKFSGLYPTADGYVRVHANFAHHRDGALGLLGLNASAEREDVQQALAGWRAADYEQAAAAQGLVVAMVRSFEQWDAHPHAVSNNNQPLVRISRIGSGSSPGAALHPLQQQQRPLAGVRVLDLTRILAGPICGRTLAAYGAEVMLVNSPELPNISSITDTSRGKRSVHLDLKKAADADTLRQLLHSGHVFVQGYRPGGLSGLGFAPDMLAEIRPGIVCVSLSAYGSRGPWRDRRGFDSLVQTAAGFNQAEMLAAGSAEPKSLPVPILDYASGFLMAFGAQAALLKQLTEGGSWHVEVSLLQTANWLRSLGRLADGFAVKPPDIRKHLQRFPCTEGKLEGPPHAAEFSHTPAVWKQASAPPGSHAAAWREAAP